MIIPIMSLFCDQALYTGSEVYYATFDWFSTSADIIMLIMSLILSVI